MNNLKKHTDSPVDLVHIRGEQNVIGSTYALPTTSTKLDINDNVKDRQNTEDVSISYFCLNVAIELQEIFVIDSQKNGIVIFYLDE